MSNKLDPMLEKLTEEIRAGDDKLDGYVLSRLNRARHAALAQKPVSKWRHWFAPQNLVPAGTLAAAVLGAFLFFQQGSQDTELVPVDDFDVIMAEESLELYEDLEFYVWLELEQANAG